MGITTGKWKRKLLALTILLALVAAACGGSDDNSSDSSGNGGSTPASDADPNGILQIGADLVSSSGGGVNFDPAVGSQTSGNPYDALWYMVFGRLMRPNADGTLTPELAESATVVDQNTIEIVVRDGVTFSDGTAFDAAAVKAAFDRAVANRATNETGFQAPFYSLSATTVTAPDTVKLAFSDGSAASWYDQYMPAWQTTVTKPGETNWNTPIGAGPMKVTSFKPADSIILAKNESYYDADAIEVAGVEITHVPLAQTASGLAAVQTGQLDVTSIDSTQLPSLSGSIESSVLVKPDATVGMHICKADAPLADARVRQAINKGMDREAISEAIFGGTAEPQTQIWPPGHKFNSPELDDTLAYDVEGAKALLADAGYANGFDLDVYSLPQGGLPQIAEIFKEEMAVLGINVNFIAGANYLNDFLVANKRAVGFFPGNSGGVAVLNAWVGEGVGNVCDYNNEELNDLFDEIKTVSSSEPEAVEIWQQINELVVDQALNGFVVYRPNIVGYDSDRVGGVAIWPLGAQLMPDITTTYVRAG
jgi:peptide/nickel transport system substrate-binding protein